MKNIDELRVQWDGHSVIVCWPSRSNTANCEVCERRVWALPESIEKAKAAEWHLVCRECARLLATDDNMKFGGRFKTSEEAKRVLP